MELHSCRGSGQEQFCSDGPFSARAEPNYKHPGLDYQYKYDESWEHSDWMLATFVGYGADKVDYMFMICWDSHADPEV